MELLCENCKKRAVGSCDKCESAFYCSKECQDAHWQREHKMRCFTPVQGLEGVPVVGFKIGGEYLSTARPIDDSERQYLDAKIHGTMERIEAALKRVAGAEILVVDMHTIAKNQDTIAAGRLLVIECSQARRQPGGANFLMTLHDLYLFRCPAATGVVTDELRAVADDLDRYANVIVQYYSRPLSAGRK